MRWWLALALLPSPLSAQVAYPPVDATTLAAKTDIPGPCANPPAPDGPVATAGTGATCIPRADAARQTPIPQTSTVTLADGSFSGNWPMTLAAPPTRAHAWIESSATPYLCQVATRTSTGYTGKCWQLVSTALPLLATSLLGLVVSPFQSPAANLTVNVLARQ